MKKALIALMVVLVPAMLFAEIVVVQSDGSVLIGEDGGGTMRRIPPSQVYFAPDAPRPQPPTPPNPPDPPTNTRVQFVTTYSRDVLDKDGATAFAAVAKTVAGSLQDGASVPEQTWKDFTNVALAGVSNAKRAAWTAWVSNVGALAEGKYDKQFFQDVHDGLVAAYDLDKSVIEAAISEAKGEATADERLMVEKSGIDLAWIIQLIQFIIQMLQGLGIL